MKELKGKEFREAYISQQCSDILQTEIKGDDIHFIDEGAMNFVYSVTTAKGSVFFKQALDKAKDHERIGADLANISPLRIKYEKSFIDAIADVLPKEMHLPNLYSYDDENNILMMSDVAGNGILLQDALLDSNFNVETAKSIGRFLGILHHHTFNKNYIIRGTAQDDMKNWQVFLNMRTKGIIAPNKTVNQELSDLYQEVIKHHTYDVVINMDCCPKNIFQRHDKNIGLIDFELASGIGDPCYDLGFALGHYILFSLLKDSPKDSIDCIKAIVHTYLDEFDVLDKDDVMRRVIKYAGAIPLYRVVGSSPAKYIPSEKYDDLIEKGSAIVVSNITEISELIQIIEGA